MLTLSWQSLSLAGGCWVALRYWRTVHHTASACGSLLGLKPPQNPNGKSLDGILAILQRHFELTPVLIPEWFLCCQQKQSLFIRPFASRLRHVPQPESAQRSGEAPGDRFVGIIHSAERQIESQGSQRASAYRVQGSFWGTEMWAVQEYLSGTRSTDPPALPKRAVGPAAAFRLAVTHTERLDNSGGYTGEGG